MKPTITCEWCGRPLEADQAIAFWPRSRPDLVRFVCRPAPTDGKSSADCFRARVLSAHVHAIAPGTQAVGR